MARKAKVDYDEENDILYVYTGEKVKDSLEIDNFVLDFSENSKVVGVEIFNASKILSRLTLTKISKSDLSEIVEASIGFSPSRDLLFVVVWLVIGIRKKEKKIPIQIPAPKMVMSIK